MDAASQVEEWEAQGSHVDTRHGQLFVRDQPAREPDGSPPLLVIHGFPTCSFDFRLVLAALSERRRVVLFDQLGFGLSDKPDRRYGIHLHADCTQDVAAALGLSTVDLLTHDMGDSVGGEVLARDLDRGRSDLAFRRRVVTNGSIYLALAHLTPGQQFLMALPDEAAQVPDESTYVASLANTMAEPASAPQEELAPQWPLLARNGGERLLPRTIRYLEDRMAEEERYTGAIERHPAPLGIVWGAEDPIAVVAMAHRLAEARPDAALTVLDGVGHYPMVEAPDAFAAAAQAVLDAP
jgi:pimeloyl-ACP methyl ester carboxylesterase